ncbi:MAG: zinc ribbon domain-containing protein [Pseudomonadales bacterium]|jgi:putative FmdB family regulatory protein|nr:zinc ribbon domain-containing protein [Pseudomonadales bacterium]
MPIYEYQCEKCGHQLEALQKISDSPLLDCPACQEAGLRKQVSAASFRLKGGGWYETDFKTGDKKQLADSGNEAAKGSDKPSKEDAKPTAPESSAGAKGDKKSSTSGSESTKSSKQSAKSG